MSIFYSQNSEDVLLARCFEGQSIGFYVDVGAEDPIEGSVTKHFYERGWRGINIEPVPSFFNKISNDRPLDINLQCVASDRDNQTLQLCIAEGTGLSTLETDRQQALQQAYNIHAIEVQCQRLTTILDGNAKQRIDFLKIDVEGHELSVLRGLDLKKYHPRVILIETTLPLIHPGGRVDMTTRPATAPDYNAINQLITAAGYQNVYFDGLNTWWIDQAEPALADAFQTPPNCFDTISPMESHRIIHQLTERIKQAEALTQKTLERLMQAEELIHQTLAQSQSLENQLNQTQQNCNQIMLENQHLKRECENLLHQQHAIFSSKSWKITAPLRYLNEYSRRFTRSTKDGQ